MLIDKEPEGILNDIYDEVMCIAQNTDKSPYFREKTRNKFKQRLIKWQKESFIKVIDERIKDIEMGHENDQRDYYAIRILEELKQRVGKEDA